MCEINKTIFTSAFLIAFFLALGPGVQAQSQCNSFISGQAINASGDPVSDQHLYINPRNQYGEHTNYEDFTADQNGNFNLTGLCYGEYYSIMFQDDTVDPCNVNWSVIQALGQDIGIINITQQFGSISGRVWFNELAEINATAGEVEFYNDRNEFVWVGGICGSQEQCQNKGTYYELLPEGDYYIRAVSMDFQNWGRINVSSGLVHASVSAGGYNQTNLTTNITGTIIELGSMALDGTEKAGLWVNITDKDNNAVYKKRLINQTWGDVMVQFFLERDSLFNVSIYDSDGTYTSKDSTEDYNTTSVGRLYITLWNSSLAPSTNSLIRGIVIDSNGQALQNAAVKAIILSVYNPNQLDADPEGWVHRDWRNAVINSTLTDSNGNFELLLPSPSSDFVRYAIVSYWDNSTTPGADYVKEYDRNGWRGYDFSGGRQINNSIIELQSGVTLKLNIYQPGGQARINSSWIQETYQDMGDRLWRVFSMKAEKKPWGYDWDEYEADETQGGNFEDKSIFNINAPIGRNILIGGMEIGTEYMSGQGADTAPMCVINYTVQSSQQGQILEIDCNMSTYQRMLFSAGSETDGELMVLSPDDGLPLFLAHRRDQNENLIVPLLQDTEYNMTFLPWGPPTFSEIYDVNVSQSNYTEIALEDSKYFLDIEIPESLLPNVEYVIRAFPMGDEGTVAGLNMSYDIYYGNQSFYMRGEDFEYQNISTGPKSKEYYNATINISEPGSYIIAVKAGTYNESAGIYTYTLEERDVEVWNLMVDVWSDKWSFMRGDDVLLYLRAFNSSTKQPVYNANYTVSVYDFERQKDYSIVSSTALTSDDETKISFTIPQYLQEGWYRITVTVANDTNNFKGKRNLHFHLTSMNFGVRFEKFEVAPDENQTVYIVARDRDGMPVADMNVTLNDQQTGYSVSGETASDGTLKLIIPSSSYDNIYDYHEIEIEAFSPDGKKEKTYDGFVVIPVKLFIEPNGKNKFVPGENLTWEVGLVSMQDNLMVPPPEMCFLDYKNWDMEDDCDAPGPFQGIPYSKIASIVNKGDLIPGAPVTIRIYYPNGSLYYEEDFEGDFENMEVNLDNPLYSLESIGAGTVPGTYKMKVTLDDEITAHMSYKVRTIEFKANTDKSHYIMYDLKYGVYGQDNVTVFVEAINYSTGQPVPVSGSTVTAKLFSPSGMNVTPDIQNTTDSQGGTTFNFSDTSIWDEGGVYKILLNLTETGDTRDLYFNTHWLFIDLNISDTDLEVGDSFIVNATFLNGTPNYVGPIGWLGLDDVTFTLVLPDGMQYQYKGIPQENGNMDFYWAQINISKNFPSGSYLLKASGGLVESTYSWTGYNETKFTVGGYELDVSLNREGKPEYSLGDEVEVMARLTYTNGTPISGATLEYELFDDRKHTFKGSLTSPATDSEGMTSATYGPQTADYELSKDGVYMVKVRYMLGDYMRAKDGITFIITGIDADLTTDKKEYTAGEDLVIRINASKQGAAVYNGTPMAMIIPPGRTPYPVWSFNETVYSGFTIYNTTISGLLQTSGRYFIMGGVDDINGSFGGDATEIVVQDFNLTFQTENMTYTESDNVTLIINATNDTGYMNGTFTINLFRKGSGEVNQTQGSIEGNATVTFLNMTPGAYMAELLMVADNGNRSIENSKFGVKSGISYTITTKDSSDRIRSYFKSSEVVKVYISPSLPADSSVIVIAPDGSMVSLPAESSPVTISASQKSQSGWYLLRLESGTGVVYSTSMFQVKT